MTELVFSSKPLEIFPILLKHFTNMFCTSMNLDNSLREATCVDYSLSGAAYECENMKLQVFCNNQVRYGMSKSHGVSIHVMW